MTEFEQKVLTELAALSQSVADSGSLIIEAQVRAESAIGVLTTGVGSVLQELGDVKNGIALLIEGKAQILDKLAGIAQSIEEQTNSLRPSWARRSQTSTGGWTKSRWRSCRRGAVTTPCHRRPLDRRTE